MSIVSGKRKLSDEPPSSVGLINAPAVKHKRSSGSDQTIADGAKALTAQEYIKLKQYLKQKKKILKVRPANGLYNCPRTVGILFGVSFYGQSQSYSSMVQCKSSLPMSFFIF